MSLSAREMLVAGEIAKAMISAAVDAAAKHYPRPSADAARVISEASGAVHETFKIASGAFAFLADELEPS